MSTRKFVTIVIVALFVWFVALLPVAIATAETDFYPMSAVVVDFDVEENIIVLQDGEGQLWTLYWEFTEDDSVEQGDIFSLLMWEAGTPEYQLDDEIIDAANSYIKAEM